MDPGGRAAHCQRMETAPGIEAQKRAAAEAAVVEVRAGMLVGLGTGTTAAFAIAALGRRVASCTFLVLGRTAAVAAPLENLELAVAEVADLLRLPVR